MEGYIHIYIFGDILLLIHENANGNHHMHLFPDTPDIIVEAPVVLQYTERDPVGSDACAYTRRFRLSTTVVRRTVW